MREIKFRAWDTRRSDFVEDWPLAISYDGQLISHLNRGWDYLEEPARYIVEQFTGLKDKNGKEIYEGDIIMDPLWWWGPCAVEFHSGQVGPCRGENVMEWRLSKCHNLWDGKDVEVIGNIHENPELLEASK